MTNLPVYRGNIAPNSEDFSTLKFSVPKSVSLRVFCHRSTAQVAYWHSQKKKNKKTLHWEKFCNMHGTFKRVFGILVNWRISVGILTRIARYPYQNTCWNVTIYLDLNNLLKCVVYVAKLFSVGILSKKNSFKL